MRTIWKRITLSIMLIVAMLASDVSASAHWFIKGPVRAVFKEFDNNNREYVEVGVAKCYLDEAVWSDGVLYSKGKEYIIEYPSDLKKKKYIMPETVKGGFENVRNKYLEELVVGKNYGVLNGDLSGLTNLKVLRLQQELGIFENLFSGDINISNTLERIEMDFPTEQYFVKDNVLYYNNPSRRRLDIMVIPASGGDVSLLDDADDFYEDMDDYEIIPLTNGEFSVSKANDSFTVKDGVLYSKNMVRIIGFPMNRKKYTIPKTVENAEILFGRGVINSDWFNCEYGDYLSGDDDDEHLGWMDPNTDNKKRVIGIFLSKCALGSLDTLKVAKGNDEYKIKDGALYSKNEKILYGVLPKRKGVFTVPKKVSQIKPGAFAYAKNLTKIVIPGSIKNIKLAFYDCKKLKTIVLKKGVKKAFIDMNESLKNFKNLKVSYTVNKLYGNYWVKEKIIKKKKK